MRVAACGRGRDALAPAPVSGGPAVLDGASVWSVSATAVLTRYCTLLGGQGRGWGTRFCTLLTCTAISPADWIADVTSSWRTLPPGHPGRPLCSQEHGNWVIASILGVSGCVVTLAKVTTVSLCGAFVVLRATSFLRPAVCGQVIEPQSLETRNQQVGLTRVPQNF